MFSPAVVGSSALERAVLASADVAPLAAVVAGLLLLVAVVAVVSPACEEVDE